jgi:hypothetical protein
MLGTNIHKGTAKGKFQGVMTATMPRGFERKKKAGFQHALRGRGIVCGAETSQDEPADFAVPIEVTRVKEGKKKGGWADLDSKAPIRKATDAPKTPPEQSVVRGR